MKSRPAVFLLLLLFLALLGTMPAAGQAVSGAAPQEAAWAWVNRIRAARHLDPLPTEPALERAAAAYAALLASSGRLAHRDGAGRGALARYRAAGGSAARVGEILGAGPDLESVTAAWEASPAHAAAALDSRWTHVGAASAPQTSAPAAPGRVQSSSSVRVWVVLFAEQRVEGFRVVRDSGGGYEVSGAFRDAEAAWPVLLSGLEALEPAGWEQGRRAFLFRLPGVAGPRYQRLGYRAGTGKFTLTSAFYPEPAAERVPAEGVP
jgi:hypothetical protein